MINYDKETLCELAEAFYTLSEIRMGLLDNDGYEFFAYPEQRSHFCTIVRSNLEINKNCVNCDLFHMQKCKSRKIPVVYTCHLGLTEVIAPIKEDNVVICYFMFGQIIIDEFKDQTMFQIYDKVKDMSFKNDIIKTAIDNIHCVTGARLSAAVKILETILTYIFSTKTISATRGQFVKRLDAFIDSHLTENVLIHDLQEYFNFSRTHLYEVSKSYLDCSLGEYILNRKISHAQNLLEKTKARIMEVSEQVGFSDYNYFSRVFRKKMGISPREYRNKNLPEAQE